MAHRYSEAEMTELLDKVAIREVIDQYFRGEDRGDVELVVSAFTPDAQYGSHAGHDAIREAISGIAQFHGMQHYIGSMAIKIDGDTAEADTLAFSFIPADTTDGRRVLVRGLRYVDKLVRTPQGWRLRTRSGVSTPEDGHDTLWQFEASSVPPGLPRQLGSP